MARFLRFLFTTGLMWSSLGLHLVVCACFLRRWDKVAAVTVFPFWVWALAGLGMAGLAWIVSRKRMAALLTGAWLVTLVAGADETRPLLRMAKEAPQPGKPAPAAGGAVPLRVITLNCRGGPWNAGVLEDLIAWSPDAVFLQETPYPADLQKAAVRIFPGTPGYNVAGANCSILSRTKILTALYGHQPYSMLGVIEPRPGRRIELACVHLLKAETGMKLWSRDVWRSHYYNRQTRRAELNLLLGALHMYPGNDPVIVGGDFNAPAGDGIFDLLKTRGFTDAVAEAGSGWPCTYPNAAPVLRIDHLWMKGLTPVRATAVRTTRSDHRMVVCDFLLP